MSAMVRIVLCGLLFSAPGVQAAPALVDDSGETIQFQQPVNRIVSLAPHVTELLFAAGASDQIVGAVDFSDYPEPAKAIPRVGSYNRFDVEAIVALKPDVILAWKSGNPESEVGKLSRLGFRVYYNEPRQLEDVAHSLRAFGRLLGTEAIASRAAEQYEDQLRQLRDRYRNTRRVRVFYQVWKQPLFTINGEHIISRVIELCGGTNVFSDLPILAPNVDVESVIKANPEVIVAGMNDNRLGWLDSWRRWTSINAVKNKHLYPIDADLIVRHTPRILIGAAQMCVYLERVRNQ